MYLNRIALTTVALVAFSSAAASAKPIPTSLAKTEAAKVAQGYANGLGDDPTLRTFQLGKCKRHGPEFVNCNIAWSATYKGVRHGGHGLVQVSWDFGGIFILPKSITLN